MIVKLNLYYTISMQNCTVCDLNIFHHFTHIQVSFLKVVKIDTPSSGTLK